MLPVADLINHQDSGPAEAFISNDRPDRMFIKVLGGYDAGEELQLQYGAYNNAHLLTLFGFVFHPPHFPSVSLRLAELLWGPGERARLRQEGDVVLARRLDLLRRLGLDLTVHEFFTVGMQHVEDKGSHVFRVMRAYTLPPELFENGGEVAAVLEGSVTSRRRERVAIELLTRVIKATMARYARDEGPERLLLACCDDTLGARRGDDAGEAEDGERGGGGDGARRAGAGGVAGDGNDRHGSDGDGGGHGGDERNECRAVQCRHRHIAVVLQEERAVLRRAKRFVQWYAKELEAD